MFSLGTSKSFSQINPDQKKQIKPDVKQSKKKPPGLLIFDSSKNYTLQSRQIMFKEVLAPSPQTSFSTIRKDQDNLGFTHERLQQYYKGIKVEFGTMILHSKNGEIKSLSSEYYPIEELDVTPKIGNSQAFERAILHIGAEKYLWEDPEVAKRMNNYKKPEGELVILPDFSSSDEIDNIAAYKLAYKFDIYAIDPISRGMLYIDAYTGEALLYDATIKHTGDHSHCRSSTTKKTDKHISCSHEAETPLAAGTAATRYSGTRTIETTLTGGSYVLQDNTRGNGVNTYNSGGINSYPFTNFTDANNDWTAAEYDNAAKDNAALDAHWGTQMTYDYWQTIHGRNSFDNNGAAMDSWVHYDDDPSNGVGYDNAFWNGSVMTYGDGSSNGNEGNGNFDALTSIDITAHEVGHAIDQHTANLLYQNESGALDEGFADIWGASVEHFAKGNGSDTNPDDEIWLIGDEIDRRTGSVAIRSMSNPNEKGSPDTYGGTHWIDQNCSPTSSNDFCGVHTNSGVLNYWFYLCVEGGSGTNDIGNSFNVSSIGMAKSAAIAYRTISVYLTHNSNYADARTSAIQSAIDLYGVGSVEEETVTNAWHAVGIGGVFIDYCDSESISASSEYISRVQLNTIDNSSSAQTYSDFAIISTDLNVGQDYTITITPTWTGSTFNEAYSVWVDLNADSDFLDSGEQIWTQTATTSDPVSGTITIPAGTSVIDTRMRISMKRNSIPAACETFSSGEVEDYTVNIVDTENPTKPANFIASNITATSFDLSWDASTDNVGVVEYLLFQDGSASYLSPQTTSLHLSGLIPSTSYFFSLFAYDAEGNNSNSATLFVTTSAGSGNPCSGSISSFPYTESFETSFGQWTQDTGDDIDWTRNSGTTTSSNTGPSSAVDGSWYVYVESSGNGVGYPNKQAILNSPCFDLSAATTANFSFQYHMYGVPDMGSLDLELSTDDGNSWSSIWGQSGDLGNQWFSANVNLDMYTGSTLLLRFNGVTTTSYRSDMAVDDISLDISGGGDTQAPTSPTNLSASNVTQTTVDLSWNASTDNVGVTGYDVYQGGSNIMSVTGTTAQVTGLTANTSYSFTVRAKDAAGNQSGNSNTANITTQNAPDTQAPTAPTNLSASNVTQTTVDLSWNASTDNVGVTGYDVYQGGSNIMSVTGTTAQVTGLTANTSYSFNVRAKDAAGNQSGNSNTANVTTSGSGSSCSGGISSFPYTESFETSFGLWTQDTGDDIDWTRNSGTTTSSNTGPSSAVDGSWYVYVESSGNGTGYPNKQAILNAPCFDLSAATTANFSFQYHMFGVPDMGSLDLEVSTDDGNSWSSIWGQSGNLGNQWFSANVNLDMYTGSTLLLRFNGVTGTSYHSDMTVDDISLDISGGGDTQAPTSPTNLSASNVTQTTVDLSWNASTDNVGVTGYDVYQGGSNIMSVTGTTAQVTGLTANTSYSFNVRAKDAAGNQSGNSNTVNVTTQSASDTQAPTAPTNLSASNVTQTTVDLSWNASTDNVGVTGYDVYQGGSNIMSVTGTTAQVTGLTANTSYSFNVRAKDAAGNQSGNSNTANVTTSGSGSSCSGGISSFPYTESFETSFGLWTQDTGDDIDWTRNAGGTTSGNTGPSGAVDGSWYVYVESSVNGVGYPNKQAILNSPCFDLSAATTANFSFQYHMYGFPDMGSLDLELSTDDGNSWSSIWGQSGDLGNQWFSANVNLDMYTGSTLLLRFNGVTTTSYRSDMAVDDISLDISGGGDTQAPSAPTNLSASNVTQTTVDLSWNASTDNVGVTGYDVYQGGSNIMSVTGTTAQVTGLTANTSYSFNVRAKDAAGNQSGNSNTANVTTSGSGSSCSGGISSFPYTESFETSFGLWTQDTGDDINWIRNIGPTSSPNTGPSGAVDGSWYAYVEASGSTNNPNKQAILNSPCFDLSTATTANFSFQYHMYGSSDIGNIDLELSTDDGNSWSSIWDQSGNQGNQWFSADVNLDMHTGSSLLLRFNRFTGGSYQTDVAIDDIRLDVSSSGSTVSSDEGTSDTEAPSIPTNLISSNIEQGSVDLSWDASTDNVGVTGYEVYQGGSYLLTETSNTAQITGLTPTTSYNFLIRAKDAAGNLSGNSNLAFVTTKNSSFTIPELETSSGFEDDISIYPNPARYDLTIKTLSRSATYTYRIVNAIGQTIMTGNLSDQETIVDIKALSNGLHFVEVQNEERLIVKSFVKQ